MRRRLLSVLAAAAAFFTAVDDLPLMPGLIEPPGAGAVIAKPEGRIAELFAAGPVERAAVENFYADTLPQLGWRKAADGSWRREEESLRLEVRGQNGRSEVRISIAPSKTRR